ncbi:TPA: ABC transporter permease [Staphylococcus aureus]|uniref:ABC transporter permease n=1 Tax=Staphylococcus aureus TaxID=1280 RepID=UPI000A4AF7DC|nr:ABC transporter permease [Staphylococcus aureus]MBS3285571.1 ABC transporter permease [Staphylococcus aureus]MBS3293542.1 ABC transporter permease [Staphylococcus aureus]MBS3304203.1 ABC transporter permease [Staphylococcus aureus]MBS3339141.1 ABC transporter permease [Staphylococcus aureus]MBS3341692.1 ABC transporter permease [Staphylococcus aureus]
MNKFLKTFFLTYFGKVSSKSFIYITTILIMLVIIVFNANKIMDIFNQKKEIAIVAENKYLIHSIKNKESEILNKDAKIKYYGQNKANSELNKGNIDYVLNIKLTKDGKVEGELTSKDTLTKKVENDVKQVLNSLQFENTIRNLNLTTSQLKNLGAKSELVIKNNKEFEKINQKEKDFQLIFTMINLTIMIFIIMNYVNQIAMEVAIEKTSRVIEMIITSIKPSIHIIAKILGVFAVALTQIFIFIITIGICLLVFDVQNFLDQLNLKVSFDSIGIIILNIVFWTIGVISYSLIAAILGSLTSRIEEVGQSLMPLILVLLGSYYIVLFSVNNPNNLLVTITSYVPLISPFTMLFRLANNNVDNISVAISIGISILFLIIFFFVAGRTYKYSVLTYDKNIIKNIKRVISN